MLLSLERALHSIDGGDFNVSRTIGYKMRDRCEPNTMRIERA